MFPTLYEFQGSAGTVGIHTYGLLVLTGFVAGVLLVQARARTTGLAWDRLPLAALAAGVGGFAGAKVLYALGTGDVSALLSPGGGYAWYGGVIGGGLAVGAVARPLGLPAWKLADAVAPALVLGAAIGRLGCFFAGCCHGVPVVRPEPATSLLPEGLLQGQVLAHPHFPWVSLVFEGGVARFTDVPLYPTQIWQSVGSFGLVALLLAVSRLKRFDGQVAALWLVFEPALRIFVETFRGDHRGFVVSWPLEQAPAWLPATLSADGAASALVGVTTSQFLGLCMMVAGVALYAARRRAGVAPEGAAPDAWSDDLLDERP